MHKANHTQSLKTLLPAGQVFTDRASLLSYELDAGMDRGLPDGIVFPHTPEDVARIVQWAAAHGVALIARGAGTGLSGGAVADRGGLIVEFSRMHRLLELDEEGRSAVVQPGLINLRLDEEARARGLYFPPDPASQRASTIGGNVAENAGGPHCFKYGVTSNYVMGMQAVLADGRLINVGGRALDYPTYDLCGLLTGSEGTLAIMTAISVRLTRNPPAIKTMLAVFDSVEQAGAAVSAIIVAGLIPATMEMMDQKIIRIVEAYAHAGLPVEAQALLIVEVDGYPASLDPQIQEITALLLAHGGRDLHVARSEEERAQIWFARKSAAGAITRLAPAYYTVDITVPRSRLAEALAEVNDICEQSGLHVGYVFHAGDGNLHPLILIPDPQDHELVARVLRAGRETVAVATRMGGSLTGEHGVGIEKREYMPLMYNQAELSAMEDIKQVFDPDNLLNPGKIFPLSLHGDAARDQAAENDLEASKESARPGLASASPVCEQSAQQDVFSPATAEEAAAGLLALANAGRSVSIQGNPASSLRANGTCTLLSTAQLRGIQTYAPEDLYVTVGAGTPLAEIQAFLRLVSRQVALDTPWTEATIGGIVAANVNAPLRMRYGSIRDIVLCATIALADGRVIRAGRPVMKNVAGFDMVKAFIGSHGTLGLITDVTLKLVVQPRACRTLLLPVDDVSYGLLCAGKLLPQALVASAIVLCRSHTLPVPEVAFHPLLLAYTAEGLLEDVQAELDAVRSILRTIGAPEPIEVEAPTGTGIWANVLAGSAGKLLLRSGVPAKAVAAYMIDQAAAFNQGAFVADVSSGLVYAVCDHQDVEEARKWLVTLRRPALVLDGYATVMAMPQDWEDKIDRWGYPSPAQDVMRRLKRKWDPHNILQRDMFIEKLTSCP